MTATHRVLEGLDLLDGTWYAERPHEVWTWMRREAPVYYDAAHDLWGISRYDDVLAIEKDPKTFSSTGAPRPSTPAMPMMISMDDPDHRRRRSLVNRGFTPRRIAALEPKVARLCRRIVDRVCEAGSCDFVWDVAAPLPLLVIAELLGFDQDAHDDLLRWSDDMLRATTIHPTAEQAEAGLHAMLGFRELQLRVIAERRAEPRDDLISTLCTAEIDGDRLDDESIVAEALLLLIGGDETTRHVISGGMLALLEHPDQWAALRDEPALLPTAIEELLRWVSPVKNMSRLVTTDVEVRGQLLRAGQHVINFYPSANRDEDAFAEPERFDIRRDPNHHIAFGFGPHFCLGAALARLELRVLFQAVADRLPDLQLTTDDLPYRASNFVSGLEAMPVRFTPTAATDVGVLERDPEATAATLTRWLSGVAGVADPVVTDVAIPAGTGWSNETILFDATWGDDRDRHPRRLVARIAPSGYQVFPDDTFLRQHAVMHALAERSAVPMARVHWFDGDESWFGRPFWLMDRVEGDIPADNPPYAGGGWLHDARPEQQRQAWDAGIDAMASVHRVDVAALGLPHGTYPAVEDTLAHHLDHWEGFLTWAEDGTPHPLARRAIEVLRRDRPPEPAQGPSLVWGDARFSNLIYRDFEVVAVLDWEMSGIGDPLLDVGWWLFADWALTEGSGCTRLPGFPTKAETGARWAAATGRSADALDYYELFGGLRFTVIMLRMGKLLSDIGFVPPEFAADNLISQALGRLLDER